LHCHVEGAVMGDEIGPISEAAPLAGDEIIGTIVVIFVTVRAFEGTNVRVRNERVHALSGYTLTPLYGKPLQTGFALDQPDQGHLSRDLMVKNIPVSH
jgi:hypothetical protein